MLFSDVSYYLSASLPAERITELKAVLEANGAQPVEIQEATHIITDTLSFEGHEVASKAAEVVSDAWVDRSVVMGKLQDAAIFSADPDKIFSGVIACCTDIEACDREVIAAGINALGGLFREGYTRDCTHVLAVRPGSDKYNTAFHYAPQTKVRVVLPHWFDDCFTLFIRQPEEPYEWPDPPILRPDYTLTKARLPPSRKALVKSAVMEEDPTEKLNQALSKGHSGVWKGKKILLSPSLGLEKRRLASLEAFITRGGGYIVKLSGDELADIEDCDIYITQYRSGASFLKAYRSHKTIGTLAWMFNVQKTGVMSRPESHLVHFPTFSFPVKGFETQVITATNYEGDARRYLKKLIELMGGQFTPQMTNKNTVVVAAFIGGEKTARAREWNIPIVNHIWLEDCFADWVLRTPAQARYITFPKGVNFGAQVGCRAVLPLLEEELQEIERADEPSHQARMEEESGASPKRASQVTARVLQEETNVEPGLQGKRGREKGKRDEALALPKPAAESITNESRRALKRKATGEILEESRMKTSAPSAKDTRTSPLAQADSDAQNEPVIVSGSGSRKVFGDAVSGKVTKTLGKSSSKSKLSDALFNEEFASSSDDDAQREKRTKHSSPAKPKKASSDDVCSGADNDERRVNDHLQLSASKVSWRESQRKSNAAHQPSTSSATKFKEVIVEIVTPLKKTKGRSELSFKSDEEEDEGNDEDKPSTPTNQGKIETVPSTSSPQQELALNGLAFHRTPSRRQAASKASLKLHENALDMIKYEQQRRSNNFKGDWEEKGKAKAIPSDHKRRRPSGVVEANEIEDTVRSQSKRIKTEDTVEKRKDSRKSKGKRPETPEFDEDTVDRGTPSTHAVDPSEISVLATQVTLSEQIVKGLRALGVRTASKPSECTLLVANNIGRTEKFLCAMATARYIVTEKWAAETVQAKRVLDPNDFLLQDPDGERKFNFNLAEAVKRAHATDRKLLDGHSFYFTNAVAKSDKVNTYRNVITSAGGKVVLQNPTVRVLKGHKDRHVISEKGDEKVTDLLVESGFKVYIPEFILMGVLTQKMNWDSTPHCLGGD